MKTRKVKAKAVASWCASQKYSLDAVATNDEENAEFFRVLRMQILGEPASPSSMQSGSSDEPGTALEFMFLDLNKQSMQLLLQALYYHKSTHEIKKIVFHGCRIRDEEALELLSHLFSLYTHWIHVEISCLCQFLGNEQARILIMEIMKSKDLEHLNISSMGISDGLILWRDLLSSPHPATPHSIVMRSSRINFEHTNDFVFAAQSMTCDRRQLLKHLDLSACRMDDNSMRVVANGLRSMSVSLESLALKGNRLSPKSVPVLAQLIHDHHKLKALDLSMNTRLFALDDPATENAEEEIKKIIEAAIPVNNQGTTLERLVLSKTSVGENAAIMMIKALEHNTALEELDLNFCLLGERVMEQLAVSMPKISGLRELYLHGLHFNNRNAATNPHDQRQGLWTALQENTSLVKIQGLNMFLGAGRPELASEITQHLSERNQALYEARSMVEDDHPDQKRRTSTSSLSSVSSTGTKAKTTVKHKPAPPLWPRALQKLGRGNWTASAVYVFLQNNATTVAEFR
mmetsp:Transcript_4845/g.10292  ORF Transcript_4845/g.10292 Transcript_4845/m.10292 type:complete len:517 (-) Transcript_4845:107-1657(-)|eukprot:CAMPEP_0172462440 /NCGR_PEP_ID=MMETSP1065-20121228/43903_1 /TAXON_ID=265537 /ORGANISM="Amphiprora paludosa, Strain CCMP125" /LENGTH=516 /DNA_ID=CAMNT_0013218095 /DNA_START=30 /DNA_END=1580 /DNA_ORIENTATION=+